MSKMRHWVALLSLLLSASAWAEEPVELENGPIYESVDGVAIGRVFLSPGERERLDAVRHLPQNAASANDTVASGEAQPAQPKGVGFIQVSGKAPRVFRDGDFVRSSRGKRGVDAMPAGIIVRHEDQDGEEGDAP